MDINFDADEHPVHSNEISHSGVVNSEQGGYVLSGLTLIYQP